MKAREAAAKDRDAKLDVRHSRLETLERSLKAERTELDAKAKVLTEDRVAFAKLEKKARGILKTLYESGPEEPLVGAETAPPSCSPSWLMRLRTSQTALAPRSRLRRMPCLLRR